MKSLPYLLPLALLASCASSSTSSTEQKFKQADVNNDGVVSREEATNLMISNAFEIFDTNGDGIVDEAEFVAGGGNASNFKKAVKPGSKGLTLAEVQANPKAVERFAVTFDEADVNKSGTITYQEYLDYIERLEAVVR